MDAALSALVRCALVQPDEGKYSIQQPEEKGYEYRKDILRASHIPLDVDFPLFRPRRLALVFDFCSDH